MKVRMLSLVTAVLVVGSSWLGGSTAASANPVAKASSGARAKATVTTVVSGLDNPRDLAFGADGKLYVAEAGHGGKNCFTIPQAGTICVGFTSQISRVNVARSRARRVVSGFVSTAGPDGSAATGVDGISILGERIFGIEAGASMAVPPGLLPASVEAKAKRQLGRLIVANDEGRWKTLANVGDRDFRWSNNHKNLVPGQFPDANPYGVLAVPHSRWVVDAGSNTIDHIGRRGKVRVAAFIPNPPSSDAVPTCIDRGWDGALYIGELTGGGNAPGASIVWRYDPRTDKLTKWAQGLTAVTGCGFGHDGKFYATEFSFRGLDHAAPNTGRVVLVPAHSTKPITIVGGLSFPGGFAAGWDGTLYVSNWSIATASGPPGAPTGSVVQIKLNS
jgi:hypothetical protein